MKIKSHMFSNARDELHARGDSKYCVPVSLALLTGRSAAEVADIMEANGRRKRNNGCSFHIIMLQAADFGLELIDRHQEVVTAGGKSVTSIVRVVDPTKKYLVGTRNHVLAVINGQAHDWTRDHKHRIKEVYEVLEGELGKITPDLAVIQSDLNASTMSDEVRSILRSLNVSPIVRPSGAEVRIVYNEGSCYIRKSSKGYTLQYSLQNAYYIMAPRNLAARMTSQYANYEFRTLSEAVTTMVEAYSFYC
jgi:hypothetical protein